MKYSLLALALAAGTAALPEVKPRLRRGTEDDEHRVGGRKPSFGYREVPALIQDVDQSSWAIECLQNYQILGALPTSTDDTAKGIAYFSNYNLISQPSGLCTDTLACAFENCNVSKFELRGGALTALGNFDVHNGDIEQLAQDYGINLNLPDQIAPFGAFPKSVADVVAAVKYAKDKGMAISVKTSGHSYPGSSTLAGSVNINMRDFPKYSQKPWLNSVTQGELPAVTPCTDVFFNYVGLTMTPACELAIKRGKNATLRVGGGELWDDAMRAVDDANYWLKFSVGFDPVEVYSGAAGTVSAAGGWLQGGGLSDGSERVFGYGVDNVLELEMVLPSGQHVKFYPSKVEDAPGFLYPKTKEVTGFCNANVVADEGAWQWEECTVDVPWEDLWYAVRGGGGGSYGVVVGLTYQLHERRAFQVVELDRSLYDVCYEEKGGDPHMPGCEEVNKAFIDFWIDLRERGAENIIQFVEFEALDSGFYVIPQVLQLDGDRRS